MVTHLNPLAARLPAGSGCRSSAGALSDRACKRLAFGLILASVAFHLAYLAFDCPLDLSPDEAHYWQWSRHLAWSYYSKGPLVAWLIRASCELFGPLSEALTGSPMLAVRLPAVGCHAALLAGWYVLTVSTLKSHRTALAVVALALTFPAVIAGAVLMTIDPPFLACWCWAAVGVWKGLEAGRPTPPAPLPEGKGELPLPSPLAGEGGESASRVSNCGGGPGSELSKSLEKPRPPQQITGAYGHTRGRLTPAPVTPNTACVIAPSPVGEAPPPSPARGEGQDQTLSPSSSPFPSGRGVGSSLPWWLLAGVCSALGVLAKYPMVMLPVCVFGYLLLNRRSELKKPGFWVFALVSAVGLVPIAAWNAANDWVTVKHVFKQAAGGEGSGIRWFGPLAFAGGQVAFLIGVWFAVWAAAAWSDRRTADPARAFLWWTSVPVWGFFALASLKASGQLNWPAAAYVTGCVLAVAWARDRLNGPYRKPVGRLVGGGAVVGLVISAVVHYPALIRPVLAAVAAPVTETNPTPIRKFDPTARLRGWRTLAAEVDAARDRVRAETGMEPVVAGSAWNLPGELGVYCKGHPETYSLGSALYDRHSQYDVWRPNPVADAQVFRGRPFVVVGAWPSKEAEAFERMGDPYIVTHREKGAPVAVWWVWVGYGYNGFRELPDALGKQGY